jgi:hypothetical protein
LEDALGGSLRPLACDFRRLRFSRNARFSRSCRGLLGGAPACPSRLSLSSFIVGLFECIAASEMACQENEPMGEIPALAPLPQRTLDNWHRFVASGDQALLASLLSEHIVFRSPFVQSPIPGRPATLLVLTTVVQIFENFRYHRSFFAGSHDAALEFSANIGKWQLKGIDLITFNEAGEMIEFEVMIRPIKALQALGEEMGNRIGPQLARLKEAGGTQP